MQLKPINEILKMELAQRLIYTLGFLLWTMISLDNLINFPNTESSMKISYLTLYLIPSIILILQIIRNNKILWYLIFGLFTAFILTSLVIVISDSIERSGNHVKAIEWTHKDVIVLICYFTVLSGIDYLIFMIKPERFI